MLFATMRQSFSFLVLGAISFLLSTPLVVYAQVVPFCNPVGSGADPNTCGVVHIFLLLVNIFNFLLAFAGIVLLLIVVIAGTRMILFHFAEQPETELVVAKQTLTRGIFGFVIVAGAMLIVDSMLFILGLNTSTPIGLLLCSWGIGC